MLHTSGGAPSNNGTSAMEHLPADIQVLEGTAAEIRRQLGKLPFSPEDRLRVLVSRAPAPAVEAAGSSPRPTEFRNGVPLLPRRALARPVDLELVQRLLEDEGPG